MNFIADYSIEILLDSLYTKAIETNRPARILKIINILYCNDRKGNFK